MWQIVTTGGNYQGTTLNALTCPSDPPVNVPGTGPSAYIVNGLVVRDPTQNLAPETLDYISTNDGTTNTLKVGENTQAPPLAAANNGATPKAHNWYDFNSQINQTFGIPVSYAAGLSSFTQVYGSQSPILQQQHDAGEHELCA